MSSIRLLLSLAGAALALGACVCAFVAAWKLGFTFSSGATACFAAATGLYAHQALNPRVVVSPDLVKVTDINVSQKMADAIRTALAGNEVKP